MYRNVNLISSNSSVVMFSQTSPECVNLFNFKETCSKALSALKNNNKYILINIIYIVIDIIISILTVVFVQLLENRIYFDKFFCLMETKSKLILIYCNSSNQLAFIPQQ